MRYQTPAAFRQALDARLRDLARSHHQTISGLQRRVTFERLLARFFLGTPRWILKGGYALELRLGNRARTTVDIDLSVLPPSYPNLLEVLREVVELDMGDFFQFRLSETGLPLQGPPLGGIRLSVESLLDGRPYSRFVVDVGQGDEVSEQVDWLTGQIDLGFAGLPSPRFAIYPLDNHFAEKLHAYSKPREHPTRVKDLIDLALLLGLGLTANPALLNTVEAVFNRYATHPLPDLLPSPPSAWTHPFSVMADTVGLVPSTAQYWHNQIEAFLLELRNTRVSTTIYIPSSP